MKWLHTVCEKIVEAEEILNGLVEDGIIGEI